MLISLNLSNFITTLKPNTDNMFDGCDENLIFCINSKKSYFYDVKNNDCSDICFYKDKKIIFDIKKCSLNCTDLYIMNIIIYVIHHVQMEHII
jgi:hypothetical protein